MKSDLREYSKFGPNLHQNLRSAVKKDDDLDDLFVVGEATDGSPEDILAALDAIDRPKRTKQPPASSPQTLDDDVLGADDVDVVEALVAREEAVEGQVSKITAPVPPRPLDDDVLESLRTWKARDDAWRARQNKQFDDARARIHVVARQAKADARRDRDVVRKRKDRAGQVTSKRIHALERATAHHDGDHFLISLVVPARELATFREALAGAMKLHGPKASLTKIAATYTAMTGFSMTKDQARRRREVVTDLEVPGRPWHRWRSA
jgi:hypothetical protein